MNQLNLLVLGISPCLLTISVRMYIGYTKLLIIHVVSYDHLRVLILTVLDIVFSCSKLTPMHAQATEN